MRNEFGDWLRERIKETGKTQKEFAQIIGIEQPQLSRILSGERGTTDEVLNAISRALHLPPVQVFRAAGFLPPAPEPTELKEEINHLIDQLPPGEQEEILELLRFKVERKATIKVTSRTKKPARSV